MKVVLMIGVLTGYSHKGIFYLKHNENTIMKADNEKILQAFCYGYMDGLNKKYGTPSSPENNPKLTTAIIEQELNKKGVPIQK